MSSPSGDGSDVPEQQSRQWAAELCECFTYRTQAEKLRFTPLFLPCSCFCPCVMLGRINSKLMSESSSGCCQMGSKGRSVCLASCCCCPCLPCFSLNMRRKAMEMNNVPGECCEEWKAMCCACSLFQIYVSLDEWEQEKKSLTQTNSAKQREEMKLKAQQKKNKQKKEKALPPLPTQHNNVTEIVMTYMGDIMDDDEDDLSDDCEDLSDVDDVDDLFKPTNGKHSTSPTDSQGSSHVLPSIDMIQVTIPAGHFAGSVFQIENAAGDVLEVVVPAGGKPGMKMQVPNQPAPGATPPRSAPLPPSPPPPPQQRSPVVVPDGTLQVAIPPGHFPGDTFYIQSIRGDVMEVVVPAGGQPGMMVHIPKSFSQLLTTPPPAPPAASSAPLQPQTQTSRQSQGTAQKTNPKKVKKQRSSSPKMSTLPSGERKVQVTIPDGCRAGDIFELQPTSGVGENIKVRVPPGGKPGMRVLIRLPSLPEEKRRKREKPLRKQTPVMRESPKKKQAGESRVASPGGGGQPPTVCVTIPSGVAEGDLFMALEARTGQQVLVVVPPGAQPGMVMHANIVEDNC